MPEGDTIYRTAATLRRALEGGRVTAVATSVGQVRSLGEQRLVGQTVSAVESRGKHLLIWFAPSALALHTHMRMTGSWHLYRHGERWHKPEHRARLVLEVEQWTAVCYSAPTCELLGQRQVERHPSLASLGPDALSAAVDLVQARRRLDERADLPVGEALGDQRVLAGVGNVYRCEVLFLHGLDPWQPVTSVDPGVRDAVLKTAERLLKANIDQARRTTTGAAGRDRLYVYGRGGRACRRCGAAVQVTRQGPQRRITYWCPRCQPGADHGAQRTTPPPVSEGASRKPRER